MTRIVLQPKTSSDGVLHLDVPLGKADTAYEVEIVVNPKPMGRTLPPGYFDLIGSVDDDSFVSIPNRRRRRRWSLNDVPARCQRLGCIAPTHFTSGRDSIPGCRA
jgi:hypothetical protein